ncbi:MAG: dTDP-glucose 4,6-dehydratase [Candidatus Cloacimonetes bacterium]|nr:dTDP-glucose 4,6-dehydratase [Candidatus Cloacimonadota bacterium]
MQSTDTQGQGIYLVTGGAGFIGSNFIRHMIKRYTNARIICFDALTYAGNIENLDELTGNPNYHFVHGDVANPRDVQDVFEQFNPDYIVHFAAESHVDRSILDSDIFVRTNVMGTQVLLDFARMNEARRFLQVSTDEVYGSLGATGLFSETSPLAPNSPYSASKTAADLFVRVAHKTHGLDVVTTRCSNNYGPYQFPEKLIPLMIHNALNDKPLPVYGDGMNVRDWIYVGDHCRAIDMVLHGGRAGEIYNIGADSERTTLDIVRVILRQLGKPESLIEFVTDRPGHDWRYAIDASKMRNELGWKPEVDFDEGMTRTVEWYLDHPDWIENIVTGAYRNYIKTMYEDRE